MARTPIQNDHSGAGVSTVAPSGTAWMQALGTYPNGVEVRLQSTLPQAVTTRAIAALPSIRRQVVDDESLPSISFSSIAPLALPRRYRGATCARAVELRLALRTVGVSPDVRK